MMKSFLLGLAVLWLGAAVVPAQTRPISAGPAANGPSPFFLDLWNNAAFYDTNLEKPRFAAILGRFEGKVGLNLFHFPLQVYGVYYGAASQADPYWDNYLFSGGGVRLIPFRDYRGNRWYNEWLNGIKLYAEDLRSSYFKNAASAESLAREDRRYGLEIWYAWNQQNVDPRYPWGEVWLKWDYRQTNFGWEPFQTDVCYFQPKFGVHLGDGIEAYLKSDVTVSAKEGPDYSFLNVADYGAGIRFVPLRSVGSEGDLFRTFKMFAEVLGVTYLKDKPADPAKVVTSDVRFGIEFSYGR